MKKFFYPLLATGAVMALASCASDEPLGNNQNDGSLSFTVSLPGQNTRFAEGTTVDRLYYSVFDTDGNLVLQDNEDWPTGSLTTTVTLQLVANQSYDIVFFADNKEAEGKGYTYNAETAQFSVTYGQDMVNNDKFDAFVKNEKGVVADGNAKSVTLTRPFAQLNIGTNDLTEDAVAKYGLSNFSSTLGIAKENVLSGINFLKGTTTAQAADLSFGIADFSTLPEDVFPVSGYSYIEMNYLLVAPTEGETANLINATYTINGKADAATVNTLNLASTPVRQNYRTNIYGSLLTTQNAFTVTIDPAFEGVYNPMPWDGKAVTLPVINEAAKTVTVSAPSDFAGFIKMVNGTDGETANNFEGYTVTLTQDIDFGGHVVTPIADGATRVGSSASGNVFKGTIDGNNHTIKNLTIPASSKSSGIDAFIANLQGETATLKNLKFENITINSTTAEQTGIVGLLSNGATVENVHILSGTIHGNQATGGVVGRVLKNGIVNNCSNNADISSASTNVGGIVGAAYYSNKSESNQMTISNCTNTGKVTGPKEVIGGIVGLNTGNVIGCVNKGTVTGTAEISASYSVGGIVGDQQWAGTIENCVNEGDVINLSKSNNGTGGIIGWIRYSASSSSYQFKEVISVRECTNKGNIRGYNSVGGIVGCCPGLANVIGCKNYSTNISSYNWVAGIIGKIENNFPTALSATSRVEVKDNLTTTTLEQMSVEETNPNSIKKSLVFNRNNPPHDPDNPVVIDENNTVPTSE